MTSRSKILRALPATPVTSGSEGWALKTASPGIHPKGGYVDHAGKVLTVWGERSVGEKKTDRHLLETDYGQFEHCMLQLTLSVAEATKPRQIKIAGTRVKGSIKVA